MLLTWRFEDDRGGGFRKLTEAADNGIQVAYIHHGDFEHPAIFTGNVVSIDHFRGVGDQADHTLVFCPAHSHDSAYAIAQ